MDLVPLYHTNSNSLSHVTNGEATKRWVVSESLNAHGLRGNHLNDCGVAGFDELRRVLDALAGTTIDLLEKFGEFAGNVGG